jgi:AcrR family transcriptional regulator
MATESITSRRGLSVRERRQRNHEEMRTGILEVARDIMREQGVAALNLNEIARRVGITSPALYTYFPSKMALYDELYRMGIRFFLEAEEELWRTTAPDWERIHAWFALRLALAEEQPDLYHLVFDVPVPGFVLTPGSLDEVRRFYHVMVRGIAEVIEAGAMRPNLSPEEATHLLITMRLGLVAAHIGKHRMVSPPDRFGRLVDEIVAVLRAAWEPQDDGSLQDSAGEKGRGAIQLGHKA